MTITGISLDKKAWSLKHLNVSFKLYNSNNFNLLIVLLEAFKTDLGRYKTASN